MTSATLHHPAAGPSRPVREPDLGRSIRRHLLAGATACAVLAGVVGLWAARTEFAGAVIASGQFVVDTNVKKVQHPAGGVVGEVRVRDGDRVRAGDVLVRLDETILRANLEIVSKGLDQLGARLARLEAERDGAGSLSVPDPFKGRMGEDAVARLLSGESTLLRMRAAAREGQKAQLSERIAQLREQINGITKQISAKENEIRLITDELVGVRELYAKKLVPLQRVTTLERDAVRLEGENGQLIAAAAQARGQITETALKIIQVDQDLRSEVATDIRDVQAKMAELVERRVAAQDQLGRVDIRAPQDGVVYQSTVHTVGEVVPAGEAIMLVVPDADRLTVEVKVAPHEIDQVRVGQPAILRLSAFNQRTTPEIEGDVLTVSPDVTADPKTGASFYTARIGLGPEALQRVSELRLVPGMPVEAHVQTASRTVLSYLTKPLADQVARAFRER